MPSKRFRHFVQARAGGACEYCRLLEIATGVSFHIEHVVPKSKGGKTVLSNLALSCPGCNLAKAERTAGESKDGQVEELFNPREFDSWLIGWHLHFILDRDSGIIVPRTARGEATVATLKMNVPNRVFARKLQIVAGLFA
jgi:HNH endonuclease